MEIFSSSSHEKLEVKIESNTENYDIKTFPHYDIMSMENSNTLKEENLELKQLVDQNERKYISNKPLPVSLPYNEEKIESSEIVPGYLEAADNGASSINSDQLPEVKIEHDTESYDYNTFPHYDIDTECPNKLKEENAELHKLEVKNEQEYNSRESLHISLSYDEQEITSPETLSGQKIIFWQQARPGKIESCEETINFGKMHDVAFEEWRTKNEELDIKDEDLKPNEISILARKEDGHEVYTAYTHTSGYQNITKGNLNRHLLRHGNVDKVNMLKCSECDYKSIYQQNLRNIHQLRHKDPKEVNMFKCYQCNYQSIHKRSLKLHQLRHKDPKEVKMFKCDQCDFQSSRKTSLTRHQLRHKDPKEVNMFKCDQCDFQGNRNQSLKLHQLRHKDPKEVNMFKCYQCDYQTLFKYSLKVHLLQHVDLKKVKMFKCTECDFQSIRKQSLKLHLLRHKDPKEVNMFKCDQCDFQSIRKQSLMFHQLRHTDPKGLNMFKCSECDYQSIFKQSLKRHLLRHQDPKKLKMFKCSECDFQSIYSGNLKKHLLRHKDPKEVNIMNIKLYKKNYNVIKK